MGGKTDRERERESQLTLCLDGVCNLTVLGFLKQDSTQPFSHVG